MANTSFPGSFPQRKVYGEESNQLSSVKGNNSPFRTSPRMPVKNHLKVYNWPVGLENTNQSVSKVNDWLFLVKLIEIAYRKSDEGHRQAFWHTYLYNASSLSSNHFLNICLSLWLFYPWKD